MTLYEDVYNFWVGEAVGGGGEKVETVDIEVYHSWHKQRQPACSTLEGEEAPRIRGFKMIA